MIINIENLSIGDLLSVRNPFIVEKYQRDYSWESEEIEDFTKDILSLYTSYDFQEGDPKKKRHFFGGIVCILKHVPNTATGRIYEVVDGQQRLATFFISISHIIRGLNQLSTVARESGENNIEIASSNHSEQIDEDFIHYREVIEGNRIPRLRIQLSQPDSVVFENLINGTILPFTRESHKRLCYAYNTIKTELIDPIANDNTITSEQKMNNFLKLLSCLVDNCHVIQIVDDNKKDAYRLFTILNDRGRALSDGDLLRSYSLELLESNALIQNQAESYWNEILSVEKGEIDTFLRNYFASQLGKRAGKRDLNDQYQKEFFNDMKPPISEENKSLIERRIFNLLTESTYHHQLSEGKWPYDNSTVSEWDKNRLELLINVLKHTLSLPILLSARSCLSEAQFSQIVNVIERCAFRYIIVIRGHATKLEKKYLENALKIRQRGAGYQINELISDLNSLLTTDAPDTLFESNLKEMKYTKKGSQKNRIIRYFLMTFDDHYRWYSTGASHNPRPDKTRVYDFDELSVEHIYAQSAQVRVAELEPLIDDIGNLTFWAPDDNRSATNSAFSQKKVKYLESSIHLTREISQISEWTVEELDRRRNRLIDMGKKVFPQNLIP